MIPHAASSPDAPGREARNSISVDHDAADRFTAVHEIESFVDVLEPQRLRDHRVDGNPPVHIPVDDLGNIGPSPRPAERGSTPYPAGHQLEWPRCDLLSATGNSMMIDSPQIPVALISTN